jgi:ADP-heptose:LPS heptosyltransferase
MIIYRLGSLGDTIVSLPALKLIARAFPNEKRIMLTHFSVSAKAAPMAEILQNTDLVDEYVEYPFHPTNPLEILALWRRLRALRQRVLVHLTPRGSRLKALRDALFFRACGIKTLIGVPFSPGLQAPLALAGGRYEYEGARLLRCIESLGNQPLDFDLERDRLRPFTLSGRNRESPSAKNLDRDRTLCDHDLGLTGAEQRTAQNLLEPFGNAPILAVSIGAKADVNDWGQENWCALIQRLAPKLPGWGLVLLGAGVEAERSAELAALWRGPVLNLCGAATVRGAAAVLAQCRFYIGHDSGPMHLAAAVGTLCIAIFSSRNLPGTWFPAGAAHRIFYREMECQGCRLVVCESRQKACIRSIRVEEVEKAALEFAKLSPTPQALSPALGA